MMNRREIVTGAAIVSLPVIASQPAVAKELQAKFCRTSAPHHPKYRQVVRVALMSENGESIVIDLPPSAARGIASDILRFSDVVDGKAAAGRSLEEWEMLS